jgi:UDP-N-acetylglucosamine--N-acetylmuramyl-(pentapeptide) pyrophosphoryl-undecaprenol N-acetylglucosamine transferase
VTGGSSGARRINDTIAESAPLILGTGWQIVHVTGEYRDEVEDPHLPGYHLMKYADRMDLVLAATDLTISRAGTSTVAELSALGIPAVFVPYASGNGEQRINAREAVAAGGALVVADAEFTPSWVAAQLIPLLARRARIADMAARMASVGIVDGTDRFVGLIDEALRGARTTGG